MQRLPIVLIVALVCVALVGSASAVLAQGGTQPEPVPVVPPMCENVGPFDHNRDGKLTGEDFSLWVWTIHESGLCELDGPVGNCPSWVDVNRDGYTTHADLNAMFDFLFECVYGPWRTRITP